MSVSPAHAALLTFAFADFDPSKIPRRKGGVKNPQQVVRLMAPYTMCCITCGEFIYKGKKFNAKKETAQGEEYYGIKVFRFYIKCTRCSAEITFKTDPKNADYVAEHGATRNYEPTTEAASAMPNAADDSDEEGSDEEDPMKALEASQAAAKKQMEDEDTLADLRQRNARIQRNEVDADAILAAQHAESSAQAEARRRQQEEEDEIVRQHFYKVAAPAAPKPAAVGGLGSYGSDSEDEQEAEGENGDPAAAASITVKRKPAGTGAEPTVADLLASRGIALNGTSSVKAEPTTIKRKTLASSLGIKVAKKKKV